MIFDARALAFGLSLNMVRWPSHLGPSLAAALVGVPVRVYRDRTSLRHPHEGSDTDLRGLIGRVDSAWATKGEVRAFLEIFDTKFVAGLVALQRDHLLSRTCGLSLIAGVLYRPTVELGRSVRHVTQVRDLVALDVVTDPSAHGAILNSV